MIKTAIISMFTLFIFSSAFAQEEDEFNTLLGNVESFGVYGGVNFGYTQIDNKNAFVAGGQAAIILDHNLGIGVAGKGFANEYHYDEYLSENVNLQGGYGGLLVEPILGARQSVHFSFPIIFGVGGITHADKIYNYHYDYRYENHINDTEVFVLVEPGAEVEFNIFRYFRLSLGASYRYTSKINLYDTPNNALNGFSFLGTFKFGLF